MDGVTRVLARIAEIEARIAGLNSVAVQGRLNPAGAAGSITFSDYPLFEGITAGADGQRVVDSAMRFLGVPYVWGGGGPRGFDCSGLVKYVMKDFGVELPHYTVTQAQQGTPVARHELRPGDAIFFGENGGTGFLYHVGIYVGNNSFIHAPRRGEVVKIDKLEGRYDRNYASARRYV